MDTGKKTNQLNVIEAMKSEVQVEFVQNRVDVSTAVNSATKCVWQLVG